jgi:hypothetical protein
MVKFLILHGAIVMMIGTLAGIPFGKAQANRNSEDEVRAWRVVHTGLTSGGIMMVAFACALPHLNLSDLAQKVLIASSLASGYGFAFALPLTAIKAKQKDSIDLRKYPPIYIGNMLGALGSIVGVATVIYGCL